MSELQEITTTTPIICHHCDSGDLQQLVGCKYTKCASSDLAFCKSCCECRKPFPCGIQSEDHYSCWSKHLPARKKLSRKSHVQCPVVDPRVFEIFRRETEVSEQAKLHEKDRTARWFIVRKSTTSAEVDPGSASYGTLAWTNRFGDLTTTETKDGELSDAGQFPCLVSFIGKTGAGKSTIIRGLTLLSDGARGANVRQTLETPVTRIRNLEHMASPTSAGVNLYKYPDTARDSNPILFADCEGFGSGVAGGGSYAMAASPDNSLVQGEVQITSSLYSNSKNSRSEAISDLYARFLYTFSDVVCFVSSSTQTFAADIEELLLFATKGFQVAVNKKPCKTLIFIFNQIDDHDANILDPFNLKKMVLRKLGDVWENSECLAEVKNDRWAGKIKNTEEFLEKYFQRIEFCYIPRKGNAPMTNIAGQYSLLRRQIIDGSNFAFDTRQGTWAHYNSQDILHLSELAFKHFATQVDPFDFATAARKLDESSGSMEDHIMFLLRQIISKDDHHLYSDFPKIVALAFLNHCLPYAQGTVIASPETWWSQVYEDKCSGIVRFYEKYLGCQFSTEGNTCVLLSDFHDNTHQDGKGRNIGSGPFERGQFDSFIESTKETIKIHFISQHNEICQMQRDQRTIRRPRPSALEVLEYRIFVLNTLHENWRKVVSYKTCLTCLRSLPDHVLPCGHALCDTCASDFGQRPKNPHETEILLEQCIICKESWEPPQLIQIKPYYAGIRVLNLDGGGVRGILELALLQLVEAEIALDLPIHHFFDLITGTNTGGIIALGLVTRDLTSEEMSKEFEKIVKEAFRCYRGIRFWEMIPGGQSLMSATGLVGGRVPAVPFSTSRSFSTKRSSSSPRISTAIDTLEISIISLILSQLPTASQTVARAYITLLSNYIIPRLHAASANALNSLASACAMIAPVFLLSILGSVAAGGSLYPNDPLKKSLQSLLGAETSIFGSSRSTKIQRKTRVAVMALKVQGSQVTTIANYSRQQDKTGGNRGDFERGNNEEDEFKVWEAGLCTSAMPTYFQAFTHRKTGTTYFDCASHVNPIHWTMEECQKIWVPENSDSPPVMLDVLVSVGGGYCPSRRKKPKADQRSSILSVMDQLWNPQGGEEAWLKFKDSSSYNSRAHHRLNVILDSFCPIDQPAGIADLLKGLDDAQKSPLLYTEYTGERLREKVKKIARLLVAKLFFFHLTGIFRNADDQDPEARFILKGKILCRLRKNEEALKTLVKRISHFSIVEDNQRRVVIEVSKRTRDAVHRGYEFEISLAINPVRPSSLLEIFVTMKPTGSSQQLRVPISGFPCSSEELKDMYEHQRGRYRHS